MTTTSTSTNITTTPITTNNYETTNTYATTTTTTNYDELDPGKSQPVNKSPEAPAPDPLVVVSDPVLTDTSTALISSTTTDQVTTSDPLVTSTTEATTVAVCNPSSSHPCP